MTRPTTAEEISEAFDFSPEYAPLSLLFSKRGHYSTMSGSRSRMAHAWHRRHIQDETEGFAFVQARLDRRVVRRQHRAHQNCQRAGCPVCGNAP